MTAVPSPLVSVVVPTHERPALLERALHSILDQEMQDFEVLVVNDGGAAPAEGLRDLDPKGRLHFIDRPTSGGASAARNDGLRAARGRYIAYLDDDDIFLPAHLRILVAALEASPCRVAYSAPRRGYMVRSEGAVHVVKRDFPYGQPFSRAHLGYRNFIPTLCIMHERTLIDEVGLFDESYPVVEDWDLWWRMAQVTDFVFVEDVTCEFLVRADDQGLSTGKAKLFPEYEDKVRRRNAAPVDGRVFAEQYLSGFRRSTVERRLPLSDHPHILAALQALHTAFPTDPKYASELAAFLLETDDKARATELLQQVLSDHPTSLGAKVLLGYALLLDGQGNDALRIIEPACAASGAPGAYLLLGDAALTAQQFEKAREAYVAAGEIPGGHRGHVMARLSNLDLTEALVDTPEYRMRTDPTRRSDAPSRRTGRLTTASRPQIPHRVVPILGFHRSGTSMFTSMLQGMGVDLGGPLLPPAADNPRGFWEHKQFVAVNQKLLGALGCDTDGFSPGSRLKQTATSVTDFIEPVSAGIKELIDLNFSGGTWGFKDPRTVITLPFWLGVFDRLQLCDVRPIVILRSPTACTKSLLARGDVARALPPRTDARRFILQLWGAYAQLLEKHVPEGALWIRQEDLTDPNRAEQVLARCADYLDLRPIQVAPAAAAVSPNLIHHENDERCGIPEVDELYRKQYARAALPGSAAGESRAPSSTIPVESARYSILAARNTVSTFGRPFDEPSLALHYALRKLGHRAPIVYEMHEIEGTPIVLGAQLLGPERASKLPADSILYNLEQVSRESRWFTPAYVDLMRRHRVWDYSERNIAGLREMGIEHAELCPIGVEPELCWMPEKPDSERDIDVLFYGAINDRRKVVLQQLIDAGLHVAVLSNVFGMPRDEYIRRAKVVINIHFYEAQVLELVRIAYLMANGVCVVSEPGSESELTEGLKEGLAFAPYERMVETCLELVRDPDLRARLSDNAKRVIATRSQHRYIEPLLHRQTEEKTA